MSSKRIYAGMIDKGAEFFNEGSKLFCVHDYKVHTWPNFPEHVLEVVRNDMMIHSDALESLSKWENLLPSEYVYRYILCRFGGIDDEPDITEDGLISHTEYFECGLRGKCKYEGKLCCSIKVEHGVLTKSELEILKRIKSADKAIADELCISPETVATHMQNIRRKTGLGNKVELAVFANEKGLIR